MACLWWICCTSSASASCSPPPTEWMHSRKCLADLAIFSWSSPRTYKTAVKSHNDLWEFTADQFLHRSDHHLLQLLHQSKQLLVCSRRCSTVCVAGCFHMLRQSAKLHSCLIAVHLQFSNLPAQQDNSET